MHEREKRSALTPGEALARALAAGDIAAVRAARVALAESEGQR